MMAYTFINAGLISRQEVEDLKEKNRNRDLVLETLSKVKSNFEDSSKPETNVSQLNYAFNETAKQVFSDGIPNFPMTYNKDVVWNNIRKSSSSGAPNFVKKGTLMEEVYNVVDSVTKQSFDTTVFKYPWVCFIVYQPSESGYKGRVVYCPPFEVTTLEIMFGLKLMQYFESSHSSAINIGHFQTDLYALMKSKVSYFKASGDYSSYDQTLPQELLLLAFELIKSILSLSDYESTLFDHLVDYIIHGHIYHPVTGFIMRERGIPSGSYFTNVVDGIVNLFMLNYVLKDISEVTSLHVCGDDNLIVTKSPLNTTKLSELLFKHFYVTNNFEPSDQAIANDRF